MDKALKQRLVGASVIIALAVVVLPMLLSGKPESGVPETQKIEVPAHPGELSFETRKFPVGQSERTPDTEATTEKEPDSGAGPESSLPPVTENEPTADSQSEPESGSEGESGPESEPEPAPETATGIDLTPGTEVEGGETGSAAAPTEVTPDAVPPASQEQATDPKAAAEPSAPAISKPASSGRYFVQVASLGSAENAGALKSSLQKLGYPVVMDSVESDVGRLNRVRVGPYASETEAAKASSQIGKSISGVNPRIIDLEPEQTASVTHPVDPLVRWVVQLGSFSDASNAQKLVEKLRGDGMTAYSEQVTSTSSAVYRVRVGPFLERDEALRAKEQLSKDFSLDGVVMSAD